MNGFRIAPLSLATIALWLIVGLVAPLPCSIPMDDQGIHAAAYASDQPTEDGCFLLVPQFRSLDRRFQPIPLWIPEVLLQGVEHWKTVRINGPPLSLT